MPKRCCGYAPRWMLLMSLLVAAASCQQGTDDLDDPGAESTSTDAVELGQTASRSAATRTLPPGATIHREQLVQLLGTRVPAAVGQSCPILGQVCAPQVFAAVTSCGGFDDTCDMTGTQIGVLVDFFCLNINGNATCTAIAQQTAVTAACSRVTNGASCGSPASCSAPFCLAYSDTCAQDTSEVVNCKAAGVCSNGVCNELVTQEAVGTCTRNTDGMACSRACGRTRVGLCNTGDCTCPVVGCDSPASACPQF